MTEPPAEPPCQELEGAAIARPPGPAWARHGRDALALAIVAIGAAAFAIAFRGALSGLLQLALEAEDVVEAARALPWWATLTLPGLGALAAGMVSWVGARRGRSQGVGDVMEAVVLGRVRLSMRTTLLKSLASWLAIASGGSLGREGPLIQFGGALGTVAGRWMSVSPDRLRVLVAAGTAAGFAAAYNTPLAAVLFVLEIVTGVVVLEAVVPMLIATVIATSVTRFAVGPGPIYGLREFALGGPSELVGYAGLGVFASLTAQGFMRVLAWGEAGFRRSTLRLPWRPAVGGLLTGAFVTFVPEVAGNGYEPLQLLLDGMFPWTFVALLLVMKVLATTASVSSGSPGGVFTPSLLIGGATGALFSAGLSAAGVAHGHAGGYVLVGMAAATAATTHAPLMAAVMAFELSGDYAIVLPLMLATGIATFVSRRLRADSVYTAELSAKGVRWRLTIDGRRDVVHPDG